MNSDDSQVFQLLEVQGREWSEDEICILNMWTNALAPVRHEDATEVVRKIDELCPSMDDNKQVLDFNWSIWDTMISIARSPDVTSETQERLVQVVLELEKVDKGTILVHGSLPQNLWKDLPNFGMALEAHNTDPTISDLEPFTERSAQGWLKFNEFEARLLEAGSFGAYVEAMAVLELALEEELPTAAENGVADCRVMAASIWLSRCAKNFLEWAQENVDPETTPGEGSYFAAGSLYNGRPYMCFERWGFWQQRLEELGVPDSGLQPQTREAVHKAAEAMRTITAGTGSS